MLKTKQIQIFEFGLFEFWYWLAVVQDTFMLCYDVLVAGVFYVPF